MGNHRTYQHAYETYIDLFQSGPVRYAIWHMFRKMDEPGRAKCKECRSEVVYGRNTKLLVDHLKAEHHLTEEADSSFYDKYLEYICDIMKQERSNFPIRNKTNLKISFGVSLADKFTLIRFPLCRQEKFIYDEKSPNISESQIRVCEEYLANPVGSYQGHFDRPINTKVFMSSLLPLSFSEYTEFSHTQNCCEYMIR